MIRRPTMRASRILLAGLVSLSLAIPAAATAQDVVARVNGAEITERDVEHARRELGPSLQNIPQAQHRDYIIGYLTDLHLVARAAEEAGVRDEARFSERMDYLADRTLMELYLDDLGEAAATEEDARALYEQVIGQVEPQTELHARHILVESQEEAVDIRERIEAGEDFAELAEEHSQDPGSAQRGGDLGYIQPQALVPEFAEAALALEPGELSEPVQTQFGWHIIRVEDQRQAEPPSYEEVEEDLMTLLVRQAQRDAVVALREAAEIEIEGQQEPDLPDPGVAPDPETAPAPPAE